MFPRPVSQVVVNTADLNPRKKKRRVRRKRRPPTTATLHKDALELQAILYNGLVDAEAPADNYGKYLQHKLNSSGQRSPGFLVADGGSSKDDTNKNDTSVPGFVLPAKRFTKLAILTAEMSESLEDFAASAMSNINNSLLAAYDQHMADYNVKVEMPPGSAYTSVYSDPAIGQAALRQHGLAWCDHQKFGACVYTCPRNWLKYLTKKRCWRVNTDKQGRVRSDLRGPAWFCTQHTLPAPTVPFRRIPPSWGNIEVYDDADYNCQVAIFRPTTPQAIRLWRRNHRFFVLLNDRRPLGKINRVTTGLHEAYDAYVRCRLAEADVARADTVNSRATTLLELNAEKKNPSEQDVRQIAQLIEAGELENMTDNEFNWLTNTFNIPAIAAAWMLSAMHEGQMSREEIGGVLSRLSMELMKREAKASENPSEYGSVATLHEAQLDGLYWREKNAPPSKGAELKDSIFLSRLGTSIKEYIAPVAPRESLAYYKSEYERLSQQLIQQVLGTANDMSSMLSGGASMSSVNAALGSSSDPSKLAKADAGIDTAAGNKQSTATTVDVLMASEARNSAATKIIKDVEVLFVQVYQECCEAHDMAFVAEFRSALLAKFKELTVLDVVRRFYKHGGTFPESSDQLTQPLDFVGELVGADDSGDEEEEESDDDDADDENLEMQLKLSACMSGLKRLMATCEHILAAPSVTTIQLTYETPQPLLSSEMVQAVDDVSDKRQRELKERRTAKQQK